MPRDKSQTSYRESFGLSNPPKGAKVYLNNYGTSLYNIIWPGCPDLENVIEINLTKRQAEEYIKKHKWVLIKKKHD